MIDTSVRHIRVLPALIACVFLGTALLAGCESEPDPTTYVARVGDMVLTDDEVATMLSSLPANVDTAEARQQVVEQWVTRSLLLQEAERLNLREDPTVQRRMREQERSILVTALTDRLYTEAELGPSDTEIRNFFQSNQRQMTLREPFVRVRHLSTRSPETADSARTALQEAATAGRPLDSTFTALIDQHAAFPDRARRLTEQFVPESRLFGHHPYVRDELSELGAGELAPVVEDDSLFHVLQLVERIPEGSEPELAWVEDEIRRRLTIRSRKQMYAREVQRLRNQALARNDLQFGTPNAEDENIESEDLESGDAADEVPGQAADDTLTPGGETGAETGGEADTETGDAPDETPPQAAPTPDPNTAPELTQTESDPATTLPADTTPPTDTTPEETTPADPSAGDTAPAETSDPETAAPEPAETGDPAETSEPADTAEPAQTTDPETSEPTDTGTPEPEPDDTTPSDTTSPGPTPAGEAGTPEDEPSDEPSEQQPSEEPPAEEPPDADEPVAPADTTGDGT